MHFKIREAVHIALATGEIWFTSEEEGPVMARREDIVHMEYMDDGHNSHLITLRGNRVYTVAYAQFAKVKMFRQGKDPSKTWDPWIVAEEKAKAAKIPETLTELAERLDKPV